jgi:hypothetical protein
LAPLAEASGKKTVTPSEFIKYSVSVLRNQFPVNPRDRRPSGKWMHLNAGGKSPPFDISVGRPFMLGGMDFLAANWAWSIAAVAAIWCVLVAAISLIECKGDLAQFFITWRLALFERPWAAASGGFKWLREKVSGPDRRQEQQVQAQQLSEVLQIPIVDAELALELSSAFFQPTADANLNGEALELLFTTTPRNETWRARAGECCEKLRAVKQ